MSILAAAAVVSAAAAAYGAYESGQASQRAGVAQRNALAVQRRQMDLSEQQQAATLAPTTNARGDRTSYTPGVGWVEDASPLTRALMGASDQEELLRLTQDLPRARMNREAMFRGQQDDRGLATALLARTNEGARNLADIEAGQIREGTARQVAEPQRRDSALFINALRQGSGATDLVRQSQDGNQSSTRLVLEQARNAAPRMLADNESARLNDGLNRYGTLMQRATANPDIPFTPNTLADTLTTSRMSQQRMAPYGLGMAGANLKPVGEFATGTSYGNQASQVAAAMRGLYNNQAMQEYFKYGNFAPGSSPLSAPTAPSNAALADKLYSTPNASYKNW